MQRGGKNEEQITRIKQKNLKKKGGWGQKKKGEKGTPKVRLENPFGETGGLQIRLKVLLTQGGCPKFEKKGSPKDPSSLRGRGPLTGGKMNSLNSGKMFRPSSYSGGGNLGEPGTQERRETEHHGRPQAKVSD